RCGSMVGYHETSRRTTRPGSTRPARRPRGRRPRPVDAVAPRQAGGEEVKAMARAWEPEFIRLWEAGATQADIAAALGIAAGTARARAYTVQQEGKLALRPRGGRREPRAGAPSAPEGAPKGESPPAPAPAEPSAPIVHPGALSAEDLALWQELKTHWPALK